MNKRKAGIAAVLSALMILLIPFNAYADVESAANLTELAKIVNQHGVAREASFSVEYTGDEADLAQLMSDDDVSFLETGIALVDNPATGEDADYLAANLDKSDGKTGYAVEGNTISFDFLYFENKQQMEYVEEQIPAILSELEVAQKTNYEKVKAIHDYVCGHIRYVDDVKNCSSMYNALTNGTGLCNAYALCMYRLCVEAGVPCKFIGGKAGTGKDADGHAWNIVALGDQWYLLDATWDDADDSNLVYDYFLKGSSDFDAADPTQVHTMDAHYSSGAFATAFPIATTAFDPETMSDVNETVKIGSDDYDVDPTPTPTAEPTATPTPTVTPTPTPEPTGAPEPIIVPDPAPDVDPSADPSKGKTPSGDPVVVDEGGVKTTTQKNADESTTVIVEDSNTHTTTITVTEQDGTVKSQSTTIDGSTGYTTLVATLENGDDLETKTVVTKPTGEVVSETSSSSKTVDGVTTVIFKERNENGETDSIVTTEANGDYNLYEQTLDANGKIVEVKEGSKETQSNGDTKEEVVVKDGTGKELESTLATKTSNASTGYTTETKKEVHRDGTAEEKLITKTPTGGIANFSESKTDAAGLKEGTDYVGSTDGKSLVLTSFTQSTVPVPNVKSAKREVNSGAYVIPSQVTGLGDDVYVVSGIGENAFAGATFDSITVPESILTIAESGLEGVGAKEITFEGKIGKKLLGKNALKENGTKAKGKGLTIYDASKKDMKTLKKQLKKAGVPKAKIKVAK